MRLLFILVSSLFLACTTPALAQDAGTPPDDQVPAESAAIQVRTDRGVVAWYEPAADGSGQYVYSRELNHPASRVPFVSLFYGRSGAAIALFLFGLFGQAMFMGRFALQWIVSERAGRSIVPLGFWWLSLSGSTILLSYFLLQREPIGILGQLLGLPIYLRNIYMLARDRKTGSRSPSDPASHPVPDPNAEA
ncbi:MAG: lipid-A-disaccharide synthase N-terminal domain-containing protein [Phycisphaerales bacterium]|nr:lipid-A-disaccharide synthase N-terminal domain-containing protein [Phycisphaerales bacterium]